MLDETKREGFEQSAIAAMFTLRELVQWSALEFNENRFRFVPVMDEKEPVEGIFERPLPTQSVISYGEDVINTFIDQLVERKELSQNPDRTKADARQRYQQWRDILSYTPIENIITSEPDFELIARSLPPCIDKFYE